MKIYIKDDVKNDQKCKAFCVEIFGYRLKVYYKTKDEGASLRKLTTKEFEKEVVKIAARLNA